MSDCGEPVCSKCGGSGWVWGHELDEYYPDPCNHGSDDTRYICDKCGWNDESLAQVQIREQAACAETALVVDAGLVPGEVAKWRDCAVA